MGTKRLTYSGRQIEVNEDVEKPKLSIDGEDEQVQHVGVLGGAFWSHRLAFRHFESVEQLAKAIVDREEGLR